MEESKRTLSSDKPFALCRPPRFTLRRRRCPRPSGAPTQFQEEIPQSNHIHKIMDPPRSIPEDMMNAYTLDGEIQVKHWYLNGTIDQNANIWSESRIQSFLDRFTFENIQANTHGLEDYPNAAKFHMDACVKYIDHIKHKNIAVIGSIDPWIEAILVNAGAKSVTTVEWNVPVCNHAILRTISYNEFVQSTDVYDSIFSYSSIEHSGLGRYGDPLNPNGDIETMEHIYNALLPGGVCFVGFPVGKDTLVWNAHRIYGEKRLKLIYLDKFKELEWIGLDKTYIFTCEHPGDYQPNGPTPLIVLQK